jgi:hypothetical protein
MRYGTFYQRVAASLIDALVLLPAIVAVDVAALAGGFALDRL